MKEARLALTNKDRGFTLVEAIIAIFVISIGVTGVFSFLQNTVYLSPSPDKQLMAAYLAQEGVEIVRNIRDTNYIIRTNTGAGNWDDNNLANCAGGCEADYDDSLLTQVGGSLKFLNIVGGTHYEYGAGTQTIFQREIIIAPVSPDQLDIRVEVTWQERGKAQAFAVDTQLFNWAGF